MKRNESFKLNAGRRVAYATNTGVQMDTAYEQCVELPRAIATPDGHPMKGTKSNTTSVGKTV